MSRYRGMDQRANPGSGTASSVAELTDTPASMPVPRASAVREIVIVDAMCDRYADFVRAAETGEIGLHFCVDGRSALRLSRRFRADAWLVAGELPDMSGFDLISMLSGRVMQSEVDPLLGGSRISLQHVGRGLHAGVFLVADSYRLEDEQQALASGVAGYLVGPVAIGAFRDATRPQTGDGSDPMDGGGHD